MEEARSVQVHFEPIPPQSLGVSVSGSGEVLSYPAGIFCAASCTATFDEGSTVYLVASADPGYLFGGWSGSCSGGLVCAVPMDGSESASAEFEREIPIGEAPSPRVPRAPAVLPTPTVTLRRLRNDARRVDVVSATISGPGHLSVAAPLLRHVQSDPGGSGAVTLPVALNGAGEAALRRSPHHRLRVEVTVVFMPTYRGTPAGATTAVTFTLRGGP
jgi:hypothetical protein